MMRRADTLQCWQLTTRFDHASRVKGLPLHDLRRVLPNEPKPVLQHQMSHVSRRPYATSGARPP